MKVPPVSGRWGAALAIASLSAVLAAPAAQAAPTDRAQATTKALSALNAQKGDEGLVVFGLRATVPAGTAITQAGPETTVTAAGAASTSTVSARLARAGVKAFSAGAVLRASEPSWIFYADQGPSQAFEHPGRVAVVGARTGEVTLSEPLRWVPLVAGKLPPFFRSAADYRGKRFRVFDRPWKQKVIAKAAQAPAAAAVPSGPAADAQKRLADALASERSCALRVSDTLGDFYDFGNVDKTRASLGRALTKLARLNGAFVSERYLPRSGRTPIESAQRLISRGCADLFLYVAGSGTKSGAPGIVVGVRPTSGGGVQWHTITAAALEALVRDNRNVTFKLVFDAPYAGRVADALKDERNVTVLLTPGGAGDPSFTYLPQILGGQGVVKNTTNPLGLLEFTNNLVVGIERFSASPDEIDHAIAERAVGRSDSVMAWMLARAFDLGPTPFAAQLLGTTGQRVPVTSGAASRVRPPVNHAPFPATPPQFTREDTPESITLLALDGDRDPLTFTVLTPPSHGTLTGNAPFLRYTPDRDFHGFDSLTYRVSDGRGGVAEQTVIITVISDNDAPAVVSGPSSTPPTFTENGAAVVVDNALTVTDADSPQLAGAKVEIVAGRVAGDVLAAAPPAGIAAAYDGATGVLTLTGTATRATYQAALRSVTFGSTSEDPGTARTIRFTADDGDELGLAANRDVTVVPVNDAPVNTVPSARNVEEDTTLVLGGANKVAIADPDARADAVEVTVSTANGGKLIPATTTGLTHSGSNTTTLKLTGPQAAINAALDGLSYVPATNYQGTDTVTVATSDLGRNGTGGTKTDSDTFVVTVGPVNDAPLNTVPVGPVLVVEDGFVDMTVFDVADSDAGAGTITARLTADHGTIMVAPGGTTVGNASGDVTITGTLAQVKASLASVRYTPIPDYAGADTITLTTDDGGNTGAGGAKTDTDAVAVTVSAVNDAPVLTSPAGTVNVDEDTPKPFAAGTPTELSVADVDAGTGAVEATLTASAGTLSIGFDADGIATGNGTGTLVLTGTLAQVNGALDGLVYTSAQDASGAATIQVEVTDQGNTGAGGQLTDAAIVDLAIAAINDAPVLAPTTGAVAYTEDGAAATVAGTLTVSDVDDTTLQSATVNISAGRQTGDVLGFVDTASVDGTYDPATGTLTLVPVGASATLAQFQAALRSVTFSTSNDDPTASRTLELRAQDDDVSSAAVTRTVTITPANDAPQIANSGGTVTVNENDADGEIVDSGLTLSDPDDTQLTGASVAVTANRESGDRLTFADQNGITGSAYDAATGTLALTGTATVAQYRDALRSVRFVAGGQNPTTATRTVRFTVSDGDASATSAGKSVAVQPVNDAPVNTVPGNQSVNENATLTFGAGNALSVGDVDAGGGDVRVTLTATNGTLTLGGTAGLTFTTGDGDVDATMTFEGTIAAINTALAGTTYSPTNGYSGAASVQIVTNDLGRSGGPAETDTDTVAVQVLGLNKAPVNALPGAQSTPEDTDLVLSAANGNALTISDPDAGTEPVQVALTVTNGTLTLAQTTGLTIVSGADGTAAVTVRGTLANLNAAFDGLRYTPTGELSGSATLSVTTDDLGNVGQGGAKTDSDTLAITVSAVNDAPVLTAPAAATVVEEGTVTFSAGSVNPISVADIDSGAGTVVVDLTSTGGTASLGSTAGVTVTGNGTAAVKVTGTRAAVNAALEGTTFTGAIDFDGAAQLKVDVSDQGNTGSGGAKTDSETIAITVTGVNDAPVITSPANASVSQNSQRTFSTGNGNAISITDVDAGSGTVRVQLAVAEGELTLSGTTGLTFTTGDGTADAALDATGTLADVNAALNGLVYRPANGYAGADQLDVDVDDLGSSGTGGAKSDSATVALTVNAANTAPVNTVPGAQSTNEDTPLTFAGATKLAVADDNVDAATGALEVDLDVDHGVLTLDGTAGLTVPAGADGTAAMTIKGAPNAINAALDGLTYTPDLHYGGSDTLTIVTDDLGESGPPSALTDTDTVALTVTAQNDAPVLTAPGAIAADEDIAKNVTSLSVADVDAGAGDIQVRLAVANGTLTLGTKTGLTFTTGVGTANAEIVAEGTVGELNAALATLSYTGTANSNAADTLDVDVSDLGLTGAGGVKTDAEDVPITVAAVNDAPVNTTPGAQTIDEDTTLTLNGGNAVSVADVDAASLRVTVQATQGTLSLSGIAGLSFTTGTGTADSTMTFTGAKAAINTALNGLTYTPNANYNGAASIGITTNDQGDTGSGGAQQDQDTVAITVTAVNDAPVLTQPDGATLTYTEDDPSENHELAIAPNLTVADIDNANIASATVRIGTPATGDALTFTAQNGISNGGYDSGTGTLTLTGSSTKANYETALRSVKYRTTSENPDTTQRTVTFRVDDGQPSSNLSNQVTRNIDVVRTNDAPIADDESYSGADRAIGNTSLVINDPSDVGAPDPAGPQKSITGDILAGDTDPDSPTGDLTVTPQTNAATTGGGRVTIEADGDFTYLPEQGCADTTDTFAYTISDNHPTDPKTDTGTLTFSISDCVWYVDDSAAAPAAAVAGTSVAPYPNLDALDGAGGAGDEDASGDKVFLYAGSYTAASTFPLEASQQLLTQRHGLRVADGASGQLQLEAAGPPNDTSTVSGGIVASTNNTLQGVTFGAVSGGYSLSGTSVGALTVNTVTDGALMNAVGGAVGIAGSGNTLAVALKTVTAAASTGAISLTNATGTFTAGSGTLSSTSGTTVALTGGSLDFTLDAKIEDDAGQLVSVSGQTGGTKDFNGLVTDTPFDGDGGGVSLSNNTGATIRFDGGVNLSTGAANGFSATGGGTVAIADPPSTNNTLATTTGTPLTVTSTSIHADDLTFESISSNGAANGIALSSTGNAGGLNVTSTGTGACEAATTGTCSGGAILASTGPGIIATNVGGGIALSRVRLHGGLDDGVRATTVSGLQIADSLVTTNGNAAQERGLDYSNVTGALAFNSSEANGNHTDNVRIVNDSGSVEFDVTETRIISALNGDGFQFLGDGTATMQADVIGSEFRNNKDDAFQLVTTGANNATMYANVNDTDASADASQTQAGALFTFSPGGNATARVAIDDLTLTTSKGPNLILSPTGNATLDSTVVNSNFSAGAMGMDSHTTATADTRGLIQNTTVQGHATRGMNISAGEGTAATSNFTLNGNTISNPNGAPNGLTIEAGISSTPPESGTVCADVGGPGGINFLDDAAIPGYDDVFLATYNNSTMQLPDWTGGLAVNYFRSRNTPGLDAFDSGPKTPVSVTSCQNPTLPPAP